MVELNEIVVRKDVSKLNQISKVISVNNDKIDLEVLSVFNTNSKRNIFFTKNKVVETNANRCDFIPYL